MQKILRSLLTFWIHKVIAIEESKDLEKYDIEELIGSLMTHEIHIHSLQNKSEFKKKCLTLNADEKEDSKQKESSESSSEQSSNEENELVKLSK